MGSSYLVTLVARLALPNGAVAVRCPGLPLAIYREVSAHLRQCGVAVELLPQTASTFDYGHSQVGGLRISEASKVQPFERRQVEAILQHYGSRYGSWEPVQEGLQDGES